MTDEDSDDDRMERADRIRRMREGRRSRTDGAGDTETVGESDDGDPEPVEEPDDGDPESDAADAGTTVDADAAGSDESAAADESASDPAAENGDDVGSSATVDGTTDPESGETDAVGETTTDAGGFEFEASNGDGETAADDATDELTVDAESDAAAADAATDDDPTDVAADIAETQSGVAESVSAGDAENAVAGLGGATFAIPDQATTVAEDDEAIDAEGTVAAARAAAAAGRRTAATHDRTRVLEFELGDERFCLDIDYIEEIVELENMTRVPNSPSYVEGVVDLRGQVTAIINPKDALDVGDEGRGKLIIVFDSEQMDEQGHLGWVVDEVRQVTPVAEDEVNESPDEDAEHINGVINREDEDDFVVWTTPELALQST
ncbi:chemotaxis protein CheW [Halorientalis marina]|uniref:chemotaxis protein CheW n=1 Tax=Halorientalis marina TaxID=2931976 RepID=UPI001FF674AA|nr:chemotaxis protein CheW [Halorientalis marina]